MKVTASLIVSLGFAVLGCKEESKKNNEAIVDVFPQTCEAAKLQIHQQRLSEFDAVQSAFGASTEREPVAIGESIAAGEIKAIRVFSISSLFGSVQGYFLKEASKTISQGISDGIDECYQGITMREFLYDSASMAAIDQALLQTKRVDAVVPTCSETAILESIPGPVVIYFQDGTFARYVPADAACMSTAGLPVISTELTDAEKNSSRKNNGCKQPIQLTEPGAVKPRPDPSSAIPARKYFLSLSG